MVSCSGRRPPVSGSVDGQLVSWPEGGGATAGAPAAEPAAAVSGRENHEPASEPASAGLRLAATRASPDPMAAWSAEPADGKPAVLVCARPPVGARVGSSSGVAGSCMICRQRSSHSAGRAPHARTYASSTGRVGREGPVSAVFSVSSG